MRVSSKVTAVFKRVPVVEYLAARFTYRSREEWLELVQNGRVSHNGTLCLPHTLVTQGDVVTCELPDVPPQPANFNYTIIYEDEWLLGINKPANLRVHHKGKFVTANLMYHLREFHHPPYPEAQLINRLDKDTSGVVLAAKDTAVARLMAQQFREQSVTKYYLAVVKGVPCQTQGVIDWPIGKVVGAKVPRYGVSQSQQAVENAKEAVTEYEVIRPFPGHALLGLTPKSGRTHQIRVHLAAMGHPILGDALYTLTDDDFLAWCEGKKELAEMHLIARQALHCQQNRFVHPITGADCIIEAPLPADFLNLLEKLAD